MNYLRSILRLAVCVAVVMLVLPSVTAAAKEHNVLVLCIDDLRPELGCYGADNVKSPHIDALAQTGVVFDRAYCQQALCGPSRISMMSGQYPSTTGIMDLWTPLTKAHPNAMSLPRYFKERGYVTCSYGKVYHHTRDDKRSWTDLQPKPGKKYADQKTLDAIKQRVAQGKRDKLGQVEMRLAGKGPAVEIADVPDDAYSDGLIANQAIASLRKNKEAPFFMCVGITKPHLPFSAPKKYWDLYEREQFSVPDRTRPHDGPKLAFTKWGELRGYRGIPQTGHLSDAQTKELKHGYAAAISFADAQIGKVLSELDRLGLREKTIVVLWGDHGYKLGEYGDWCKHTNLELDTRVPLIVSVPGFSKGDRSSALVEIVDLFPTLAKLTGGIVPPTCDGKSIVPVLKNPEQSFRNTALSVYPRGKTIGYSLRTDRWRYTEWYDTEQEKMVARELYEHERSSLADRNVVNNDEHKQLIADLSMQLKSRKGTSW